MDCVADDFATLHGGDQSLAEEGPRLVDDAADVLAVASGIIARTELRETAALTVNDFVGAGVWALIEIVRHAIPVGVRGRLRPDSKGDSGGHRRRVRIIFGLSNDLISPNRQAAEWKPPFTE